MKDTRGLEREYELLLAFERGLMKILEDSGDKESERLDVLREIQAAKLKRRRALDNPQSSTA